MENEDRPASYVARSLDRSVGCIYSKRSKIRTRPPEAQRYPWTDYENDLLRDVRYTAQQLSEMLPGRTKSAVQKQRSSLQIPEFANGATRIAGRPLLAKTCRTCGLLLQGKWFTLDKKRRKWTSSCKKCRESQSDGIYRQNPVRVKNKSAASKEFYRQMQELTMATADRHRFPWTESDHKVLANPDMTFLEKALSLGRTYNSVRTACVRSGYRTVESLGDPERDRWIIDNPNAKEYAS